MSEFLNATNNPVDIEILGKGGRGRILREIMVRQKVSKDALPSEERLKAVDAPAPVVGPDGQPVNPAIQPGMAQGMVDGQGNPLGPLPPAPGVALTGQGGPANAQ
jgi:hypothetical protein